jgi:hypothetical protein
MVSSSVVNVAEYVVRLIDVVKRMSDIDDYRAKCIERLEERVASLEARMK